MIRVQYDTTYVVATTTEVEIWHLGGGLYAAVPLQDSIRAQRGLAVRVRALTPSERSVVDAENARKRALCGHSEDQAIERIAARWK